MARTSTREVSGYGAQGVGAGRVVDGKGRPLSAFAPEPADEVLKQSQAQATLTPRSQVTRTPEAYSRSR